MATLSHSRRLKLAGYKPQRNGHAIPGTDKGELHDVACWNWALTGGTSHSKHKYSAENMVEKIIRLDYNDSSSVYATAIEDVDNDFSGCKLHLDNLRKLLSWARSGNTTAQDKFKGQLLRIFARMHGLIPVGETGSTTYTLHMRTTEWWSFHHLALGIQLPGGRTYVQTVPGTPIKHGCDAVWDEHQALTTIDLKDLLQAHVDVIDKIGLAPCVKCQSVHGSNPSIFNKWHQCVACGAVYCPKDGGKLSGKLGKLNPTRKCDQSGCGGRTVLA